MKLNEMNVKQLIGALGYYNNAESDLRERFTFSAFIEKCELSKPIHENSFLIFKDENRTTLIEHGFYYLSESEEDDIHWALIRFGAPSAC